MTHLEIRPFRYDDLDALIDLGRISFADEMRAQGISPEAFSQQIRLATRGRMVPFRLLSLLTGFRWQMFVAELDGRIVGCGGYVGERPARLANLMVHPDYRRRGIGQALLVHRLQALARRGVPYAVTTVLATNEASLGNLTKQGFRRFDQYTIWEIPLPYPKTMVESIISRPPQDADRGMLAQLEQRLFGELVRYGGSTLPNYFAAGLSKIRDRLMGTTRWARIFEWDGVVIGGLAAQSSSNHRSGIISRPLLDPDQPGLLPSMLVDGADWVQSQGKSAVQMGIPEQLDSVGDVLEEVGWKRSHRWVQLVKVIGQAPKSGKLV